jgi:hypothetical protein
MGTSFKFPAGMQPNPVASDKYNRIELNDHLASKSQEALTFNFEDGTPGNAPRTDDREPSDRHIFYDYKIHTITAMSVRRGDGLGQLKFDRSTVPDEHLGRTRNQFLGGRPTREEKEKEKEISR